MSKSQETLLETSADLGEEFSQTLDRMMVLRHMIPSLIAEHFGDTVKDNMQCGIGYLLEGVHEDMQTIHDAYWTLLQNHRNALAGTGKVTSPLMIRTKDQGETVIDVHG